MTLIQICLEMQAKRCETIAQDKTEQALTGAPNDTPKNELEAKEWLTKLILIRNFRIEKADSREQAKA